jgi:hypothetical protein
MIRFASIALTSVLGVAGIAATVPAVAGPSVVVELPVPGFVGGPYAYARGPYLGPYGAPYGGYWHRDFGRDYYGHGGWDHYRDHRGFRR